MRDPELREKLRPDYQAACKRLIISPDFYDAIQQPNAELVTEAIERVEPAGVRTCDGRLHELDVLVLATGFKTDAFMRPMAVIGRDGQSLQEAWAARPSAYLSISIPEFPNFFMLNGPNGPVGNFSLIEVAELQFGYIMQLIERLRSGECREISATRRRDGAVRGRAGRSDDEDGVGHRLPQLVPRRSRHPRDLALVVRPVPGRDAHARTGRLRSSLTQTTGGDPGSQPPTRLGLTGDQKVTYSSRCGCGVQSPCRPHEAKPAR